MRQADMGNNVAVAVTQDGGVYTFGCGRDVCSYPPPLSAVITAVAGRYGEMLQLGNGAPIDAGERSADLVTNDEDASE